MKLIHSPVLLTGRLLKIISDYLDAFLYLNLATELCPIPKSTLQTAVLSFCCTGKAPPSATAVVPSRDVTANLKEVLQPTITAALNLVSTAAASQPSNSAASSTSASSTPSAASASASTTSSAPAAVKKQRPLLPKETAQAVQRAVVWNPTKLQTSSQKWHMQKVQRQHGEQSAAQTQSQTRSPQHQQSQQQGSSSSTRYQTRQAAKGLYNNNNIIT